MVLMVSTAGHLAFANCVRIVLVVEPSSSHDDTASTTTSAYYFSDTATSSTPILGRYSNANRPALENSLTYPVTTGVSLKTVNIKMTVENSIQAIVPFSRPTFVTHHIVYSVTETDKTVGGSYRGVPVSTLSSGKFDKLQEGEDSDFLVDVPTQRIDILTTGTATIVAMTVVEAGDNDQDSTYILPAATVIYTDVPRAFGGNSPVAKRGDSTSSSSINAIEAMFQAYTGPWICPSADDNCRASRVSVSSHINTTGIPLPTLTTSSSPMSFSFQIARTISTAESNTITAKNLRRQEHGDGPVEFDTITLVSRTCLSL